MQSYQSRACVYEHDKKGLLDLVRAYRVATGVAVYPTTWRVCLLLTSRVWNPGQDIRIWETPSGQIAALAMLWRRSSISPYLALDRFIHPSFAVSELAAAMLAWGSQRAEAILSEQAIPLTVYAQDFAPALHLDSPYDRYGFNLLKPNPGEYNAYFGRDLSAGLPAPSLPAGYSIRPVQGQQDLTAYQSLYSFVAVNTEHQKELFESDEYSHLTVVTPDGALAAYCECSIDRAEWQISGRQIGWIDYIETRPEQQGRGLGQAVLCAGLRRLQEWGADTAMLITTSTNTGAHRLYHKAGFERMDVREPDSYMKPIG